MYLLCPLVCIFVSVFQGVVSARPDLDQLSPTLRQEMAQFVIRLAQDMGSMYQALDACLILCLRNPTVETFSRTREVAIKMNRWVRASDAR